MADYEAWYQEMEALCRKAESAEALEKEVLAKANAMAAAEESQSGMAAEEAKEEAAHCVEIAMRRVICEFKLEKAALLLDCAISIAMEAALPRTQLPFVLLQDLFQVETASNYAAAWELMEARIQELSDTRLLKRGTVTMAKLALLRTSNFLLHRLSAAQHTALCGRVMMFLAYALPLGERSGVNLAGSGNELNVTEFEAEEDFEKAMSQEPCEQQESHEQGGSKGKEEKNGGTADAAAGRGDGAAVNYTLYQNFWGLQKFFVARPSKAPNGCVSSVKQWTDFCRVCDLVLSAFESKPFSQADLDRELAQWRNAKLRKTSAAGAMEVDDGAADAPESESSTNFFPTKYLSSSRLLKLQLSDPILRRNVLVQLMFLLENINLLPVRGIQLPPALRQQTEDKRKGVSAIQKRVVALLRATPPDGEAFVRSLEHVLGREEHWIKWKANKCPSFERAPKDDQDGAEDAISEQEQARKRAKHTQNTRIIERIRVNRGFWRAGFDTWREDLSTAKVEAPTPAFSDFIRSMNIAIDPENCIEEDYHPKNDDVYCWRGLRLLSRSNLSEMRATLDGSLERACKRMAGMPEAMEEDNDDAEDESGAKKATSSGDESLAGPVDDVVLEQKDNSDKKPEKEEGEGEEGEEGEEEEEAKATPAATEEGAGAKSPAKEAEEEEGKNGQTK